MSIVVIRRILVTCLVGLCLGCGERDAVRVAALSVDRQSWDSLRVEAAFAVRTSLGTSRPATPETTWVHLYDSRYDTLFAGPGPLVPVPDVNLGDGEALLLEVCGMLDARLVCEQRGVQASPKRFRWEPTVDYPWEDDRTQGRYDLGLAVERARFDTSGWEPVERTVPLRGFLEAYVEGQRDDDRRRSTLRLPFEGSRGRLDLGQDRQFDRFAYALKASLLDAREARVRFDVHPDLADVDAPAASVAAVLEAKTEADRAADVASYTRAAVSALSDHLRVFDRRARAYVDDWSYNRLRDEYVVTLDVEWQGRRFFDDDWRLQGLLRVDEGTRAARFEARRASRRLSRRWRRYVDGDVLDLGRLSRPDSVDAVPAAYDVR